MSRPQKSTRADWTPISARIDPVLRDRIIKKHSNKGDISKLIQLLLQRYIDGRILGIKLEV